MSETVNREGEGGREREGETEGDKVREDGHSRP